MINSKKRDSEKLKILEDLKAKEENELSQK